LVLLIADIAATDGAYAGKLTMNSSVRVRQLYLATQSQLVKQSQKAAPLI